MTKTKQFLTFLAAIAMAGGVNAQQLSDYSVTVGNETFMSIASTEHLLSSVDGDGGSQTVALPFNFRFGETLYGQGTTLTVRADGYVYFGATSANHNAAAAYTNSFVDYYFICPVMGGDGKITADSANSGAYAVDTIDDNGDSLLIIEFKDLQCFYSPNGSYNYQLRLHANGNISVLFNTSTASTNSNVKQNFFMVCGRNDKVSLSGSWASPVMGTPSTLPDLGTTLPEAGTVITYVRPTSFCPRVTGLAASAITSNSAILSWTGSDNAIGYVLSYGDYSNETSDTTLTLTGLNPSTAYTVSVRTICGVDDTSAAVSTSFYTTCVNISTTDSAYTEGFESWSTTASDFNPCWNRLYADFDYESYSSSSTSYMPVVSSTFAHSGLQSLRMRSHFYLDDYSSGDVDDASIAFMPVFESDVRLLNLRFWYKAGSNPSYLHLAVGVSTTIADTSTFTRLLTIAPADTSWHEYEVELLGYSGTGNRITFIQYSEDGSYSADYGYIDDIRVEELGDCFRPAAVSVRELAPTSATITWTELNTIGTYQIVVNGDESTATTVVADTSAIITLEANTEYTVSVSTLCNGEYTDARSISFRTPCTPVAHEDLPWSQNFDNVEASGNTPIDIPCMTFNVGHGYYYFPYTNASIYYGASGKSLFFYTSSGYDPQIVVLPLFDDDINTLQLSFYSRVSNTAAAFEVGTMTNPSDPTTFVPFDTTVSTATHTWEYQQFSFADYNGLGSYIALRPMPFNGYYLYLDNLSVGNITECARVASVSVDSLSAHYVHIAIADSVDQNSYLVEIIGGGDTILENIYTNEFSVDTLQAITSYTVNVYTVCSDATTAPVTISFTTPCEAVAMPFSENFDSMNNINDLDCWGFYNGLYIDSIQSASFTSGSNWHRHTTAMEGSTHVKLNIYGGSCKSWIVTPEISISSANATLSFDYALTAYNNANAPNVSNVADDRFLVLASANGGNTWSVLAAWDNSASNNSYAAITNAAQMASIPLSQYDGQNIRIAFYGESTVSGGDNDLHIDNILVESLDCAPTTAPVAETVGSDGATISWTGTGNYEYRYAPAADTANWTLVSTSGASAVLSGLAANTEYLFQVRTDCGSGLASRWMSLAFRTACAAFSIPYTTSFEDDAVNDTPGCWTNFSGSTFARSNSTGDTNGIHTGSMYLDFRGSLRNMVALPRFTEEISGLQVRFWTRPENMTNASCGKLQVGYLTDLSDTSSFVTMATFNYNDFSAMEEKIVSMTGAPAGSCIAFLHAAGNSNWYWFIDDVTVEPVAACQRPQGVSVDSIAATSATVHVHDANQANSYVYRLYANGVLVDSAAFTDSTATLSGLTPSTSYEVSVATLCSGELSGTVSTSFLTNCMAIDSLPWNEDFEAWSTGSGNVNPCWNRLHYSAFSSNPSTVNYPYASSDAAYNSSSKSLLLYSSYDSEDDDAYSIAMLPEFSAEANTLSLSFWYKVSSSYDANFVRLAVGVTSTTADTTGFVRLATVAPVDYDWHQYTVNLSAYTGTGNRIAIMQLSIDGNEEDDGTTYYDYSTARGYIDDIVVESAGSNPPQPAMYTVTVGSADPTMGSAAASATSVEDGTSVTLTATANDGYHFVNWTANGTAVSSANPFTFTVTSDTALVANFEADSTEPEECIDPANVTASLVTSSSAMISWTAGGSEPRWAIDYNGTVDTTDSNPYTLFGLQPGTTYYVKVRALCANGNVSGWTNAVSFTTENEPTGIDDIDNSAVALYPNPATTSVTLSGIAGRATVSVVDMNGRVSGTWNVENGELTIDLTGYAQGAYFVRITGEQQTAIRKLIVK